MSGETSLISIDPDGDIALELSNPNGKTQLQVSSKVMSLASPVFARMLKSQFIEGQNCEPTSLRARVIPLPDDDEEAFTLICNSLHHRLGSSWPTISITCLENVAIICNKWDLVGAISFSAETWLTNCNYTKSEDLSKHLMVAYILDTPCSFSTFSRMVLFNQVRIPAQLPNCTLSELIPVNLLLELKMRKAELDMQLVQAIENATLQVMKCSEFPSYVTQYFKTLEELKIWPITKHLQEQSLQTILDSMESGFSEYGTFGKCNSRLCLCQMSKFRDAMWAARERLEGSARGLCLDCVQRGSGPSPDVECRWCN